MTDEPLTYQMPHNVDAEQNVIGVILSWPEMFAEAVSVLKPDDFYTAPMREAFEAMIEIDSLGRRIELFEIEGYLKSHCGDNDWMPLLVTCAQNVMSKVNLPRYLEVVKECAIQRRMIRNGSEIQKIALADQPLSDKLDTAQRLMAELSTGAITQGPQHVHTLTTGLNAELEGRAALKGITGVPTGYGPLDRRFKGLQPTDLIVIAARPSMGKAQPLTAKVLMADGEWKDMGHIRIGDQLASVDGKPSEVVGLFPQGCRPIYRINLSDGRSVECDIDHLWTVESCKFSGERTCTTLELINLLGKKRYENRVRLVSHLGEFGQIKDIGVDPWLLGFLLGDGSLNGSCIRFTASEAYVMHKMREVLPKEYSIKSVGNYYDYRITYEGKGNPLLSALRKAGVMGKLSRDKHVPESVFTASRNIRANVLKGLLESDGWVQNGSVQYSSASERLANDVQKLARSLGGTASIRVKEKCTYRYKGEIRNGMPAHIVSVCLPDIQDLIVSPRLLKNITTRRKTCAPIIRDIEFIRYDEAQCIKVSHPSRLYITDGYTVTHNTTLALNIAENASTTGDVVVFSMEMSAKQLRDRSLASLGRVSFDAIKDGSVLSDPEAVKRLNHASHQLATRNLYIDDSPALSVYEIRARARNIAHQKGGVVLVVVDYMQLMSGHGDSREREISDISRGLKALAKELNCPVIALSQLNRGLEQRPNKRPKLSDLRESGAIEQDADVVLFIYRDEVYRDNTEWRGVAEMITAKFRNGEIGTNYLTSNLAHCRFDVPPATWTPPIQTYQSQSKGFE